MITDSNELPNYEIPPMDGNGTQEGIMDAAHGVIDFLSGGDTNPVAELNAWYHMRELRHPHGDGRRNRLPVHLGRPRRPWPQLCPA